MEYIIIIKTKEGENMKGFLRLNNKKYVITIVIISILTSMTILSRAKEQALFMIEIQNPSEFNNVKATVDNASPSQNTIINISVSGPPGATVNLVCHYKSGDVSYSGVIGAEGKTEIPVSIGAAVPGYAVFVDVSVISDKVYTTQTMFIPQ